MDLLRMSFAQSLRDCAALPLLGELGIEGVIWRYLKTNRGGGSIVALLKKVIVEIWVAYGGPKGVACGVDVPLFCGRSADSSHMASA
jgi:hypothetical protein